MGSLVAIVGRPNVGKSTLFNRLVGERKAIVDDVSGVTRDRHYGLCEWNGKIYSVVDTGGFVPNSSDVFESAIRDQVHIAIEEADVLIFMVDVKTGITDFDEEFANILRKSKKPVFLCVNKTDNETVLHDSHVFHKLGVGELLTISAITGSGTGDLLDLIHPYIEYEEEVESTIPNIAIMGKPNVGKSSLLNALIGEERNIVTPIAGTTRDSIHTHFNKFGFEFNFIDTAGLRKKGKVNENIEFYSTLRSVKAVDDADVCLIMVDAEHGIEAQDMNIISLAERRRKGVVIVVNKWDLIEKETQTSKEFEAKIKQKLAPFVDVPVLFISALEKQRIHRVLEVAKEVFDNKTKQISTSKLNEIMLEEIKRFPPPATKGKYVKIKYVTQIRSSSPRFAFFCNLPQYVKEPYKRFIENKMRSHFGFTGVPIDIYFRQK